ncbi:uncharacterized protein K02A2.6-like [Phlebotomus argentipes]|uniref:uncharacterized protein K02A2.6-like n=1 Tax=Phlebotomus argentipes TaxID=94469 RepID=UPI0028929FFF|nr:uncharacterized protein K02A2.6-like [Phlebotomus argentipes]
MPSVNGNSMPPGLSKNAPWLVRDITILADGMDDGPKPPIRDQQPVPADAGMTDLLAKMIALLEAMQTPKTSTEVAAEALARGITPFTHAPEQNLTFDVWFQRYRSTFLEDGKNLTDAGRVRLLIRRLDASSYEKYSSNLLPRNPSDLTFDESVKCLTKLFGKGESLFCTRRKCLQLVMRDSDDLTTHAGIVNRHCENFRLTECTSDHFKAIIFVLSLQGDKYVLVREQLLTKLETEPSTNITLDFMLEEAKRLLNIKSDSRADAPLPTCTDCDSIGHKSGYCPPQTSNKSGQKSGNNAQSKNAKRRNTSKKSGKSNAQPRTNAVYSAKRFGRRYLSAGINGQIIEFQLDCAADLSIISRTTWEAIGKPQLSPVSIAVRDAQANQIPLEGELECRISFLGKEISGRCLVSSHTRTNLFGIEWIEAFGLWGIAPNAFCNAVEKDLDTRQAVQELQREFPTVFSTEMGLCTKACATIHLKSDATPVFRPKRPVAFHVMRTIDEELERLQSSGIISPVEFSSWAAPIVVARKPNGKIRICGDYSTGLNEAVETNCFPIPDPDSLFSNFSGKRFFSHIDLSDAYLQIPVDEESSKLLTIHTPRGLFRFNRLPPGIRSAPGIFEEIVERMLQGIPGVISYFDDICVASASAEEHFSTLRAVFARLQEYNFRVKLEKYEKGLSPDPGNIDAIKEMPAPKNIHELRSFLGAVQFWGKFVPNMSEIRAPMDYLLKKGVRWRWTRDCASAFRRFKEILSSNLLLTHYDPNMPIFVASDASSHAIGCVAYHKLPDGSLKAFYHASRKLTDTESRYSQIEKEALAIIFAVKKFHRYIYGRKFNLMTDHKPLVSIFGSKNGIPVHTANRLQRWALILLGYDFEIQYMPTDKFGHADVLSRLISAQRRDQDDEVIIAQIESEEALDDAVTRDAASQLPVDYMMINRASQTSRTLQDVAKYIIGGWPSTEKAIKSREVAQYYKIRDALSLIKGCVFYRDRLVIPEAFRDKILKQLHGAHPGMSRMKSLARGYVFWPGIDGQIEQRVRNCQECAAASKSPVKSHLSSWPLATRFWQRIHVDYAKYKTDYFLLIVDAFSKWPEIFKTSTMTANVTKDKLRECFARHGLPETLVSDNGTQFTSETFGDFCKEHGINHVRTASYCPASNGQAERFVDTLKRSLEKQKNVPLDTALQNFLANYRVTPNENSPEAKSPYEVVYGKKGRTIFDLLKEPQQEPIRRNEKMEEAYNRRHGTKARSFTRGEEVYAKLYAQGGVKFKWTSGVVIEHRGSVNYNIRLANGTLIRSHINQLRRRHSGANQTSDCLPLPTTSRGSGPTPAPLPAPSTQSTPGTPNRPITISLPSSTASDQPSPPAPLTPDTPPAPAARPAPGTPIYRRQRKSIGVPRRLEDLF